MSKNKKNRPFADEAKHSSLISSKSLSLSDRYEKSSEVLIPVANQQESSQDSCDQEINEEKSVEQPKPEIGINILLKSNK